MSWEGIPPFEIILGELIRYLPAATVRTINSERDDQINLNSVFNIFVGGTKLGRGVTIEKLLVSYYGRNPQQPNSDTMLQHARMYGYRLNDIQVTRLFLPDAIRDNFRGIHRMEQSLRDLLSRHPSGKFQGLFIQKPLRATRTNVLNPNTIRMYTGGGYCNPIYPLRTPEVAIITEEINKKLERYDDNVGYYEMTIPEVIELIKAGKYDEVNADLWRVPMLEIALQKLESILESSKAYLKVKRGRDVSTNRRETQGYHTNGEDDGIPRDAPLLFMYRMNKNSRGVEVWWPEIRWPEGNYALAFSLEE